ncbi:hypothetical protein [Sphingomonas soli]|uniref:hypothetical protein n=1 Tax=Sphingomonas soli TaxID=266127 RepID=UPI000831930A|nr:hypothetical protein [Sphingomonas soli]
MKRLALAMLVIGGCAPQPVADNAVEVANATLAAPEQTPTPVPAPSPQIPASGRYKCIDGSRFGVIFGADAAVITREGKKLTLRREEGGRELRYATGGTSFTGAADLMTFTEPGLPPLPCSPIRR